MSQMHIRQPRASSVWQGRSVRGLPSQTASALLLAVVRTWTGAARALQWRAGRPLSGQGCGRRT